MFKKLRKIVGRQILNFDNLCATFVGTVCTQKILCCVVREQGHLELSLSPPPPPLTIPC